MIKVLVHLAKAAVIAITALLAFSCGMENAFKKVDGSGNVITQNRTVSEDFTQISASGGLEVIVEQGHSKAITVEADDNLQQHIKTEVKNGTLEISTDVNIRNAKATRVIVQLPEIEGIESSAGASVSSRNALKAGSIDLSSSSGSHLTVTVDAENVSAETSSGSNISVKGTAEKLETESASGSTLDAKGLAAKTVVAQASSGSTSMVNPTENLSANASSGGTIKFVKTPNNLDKKTSSGGDVLQL